MGYTQNHLAPSPNLANKQTTFSTGKKKLQSSSDLAKIKNIRELQGSWNNRLNIQIIV